MTAAPSWPRIGNPEQWRHLRVTLTGGPPGQATPAATFEIWSGYPGIVMRESIEGRVVRDVRADGGSTAWLDPERQLCLAKTGQDPAEAYREAIAIAAGPVAELYGDGELPTGWRSRSTREATTYENEGAGPLRQATIDLDTDLPREAITVEGRWRWSIASAGTDQPPDAPDVTDWTKESQERSTIETDGGPVEHILVRSSSLGRPLELIAAGGDSPARLVVGHHPEHQEVHFRHPDGRAVTVTDGAHPVAQRLVREVHERLARERPVPEVEEDAGQWDGRINALVGSIRQRPVAPSVGGRRPPTVRRRDTDEHPATKSEEGPHGRPGRPATVRRGNRRRGPKRG